MNEMDFEQIFKVSTFYKVLSRFKCSRVRIPEFTNRPLKGG